MPNDTKLPRWMDGCTAHLYAILLRLRSGYEEKRMTRKEAIEWLIQIKDKYIYGGDEQFDTKRKEALDMAVEVLKKRPPGKWKKKLGSLCCSVCGNSWSVSFEHLLNKFNYCPNCGADMRGDKDDKR